MPDGGPPSSLLAELAGPSAGVPALAGAGFSPATSSTTGRETKLSG